jgi:hypothetical protein
MPEAARFLTKPQSVLNGMWDSALIGVGVDPAAPESKFNLSYGDT